VLKEAAQEEPSAPVGAGIVLRSVRKGVVDLRVAKTSSLLDLDYTESLQHLLCCIFGVDEVRHVRINRPARRIRIDYSFGVAKRLFLKRLSQAIRYNGSHDAEVSEAALSFEVVELERRGSIISSWKVRDLPARRLRCHHELLRTSLAVYFSLDQALELVPGVESSLVDRRAGTVTLEIDPKQFSVDALIAALEAAIAADRPLAGFLPPTRAGYGLDVALIATSAISLVIPFPTVIASAGLLCSAYARQLRDAFLAAGKAKCDWNTVIAAVVGLTIINSAYLPAALMSLALRGWRSLEHESVATALARLRGAGLPADRAEWVARAALAHDASGRRAATLASSAALPTLAASGVGFFFGGPAAALAAVRPDYLSSTRFGNRMEALKTLALLAIHGVAPADLAVCEEVADAPLIAAHISQAESGEFSGLPGIKVLPREGDAAVEALRQLAQAESQRIIYMGPALDWDEALRKQLIWCLPTPDVKGHEGADVAIFESTGEGLLALLAQSRAYLRHRKVIETVPLVANASLTGLGALAALPSWMIAILTNGLTALAWASTRSRSDELTQHEKLST